MLSRVLHNPINKQITHFILLKWVIDFFNGLQRNTGVHLYTFPANQWLISPIEFPRALTKRGLYYLRHNKHPHFLDHWLIGEYTHPLWAIHLPVLQSHLPQLFDKLLHNRPYYGNPCALSGRDQSLVWINWMQDHIV